MTGRYYRAGVVEALIAWSQGTCYWPKCAAPVVLLVEQRPMMNLDIAHIRALKPDGPRYDRTMTDADRNSFDNLLLLCRPHHRQVDKVAPSKYSPEMLAEWKRIAEPDDRDELDFLVNMNEDRLQGVFEDLITKYNTEIKTTLDELRALAREQGGVLQEIARKLDDAIVQPQYADADQVTMLNSAAKRLSSLLFEDNVSNLRSTAESLKQTMNEQAVADLARSAQQLERLPQTIDSIYGLRDVFGRLNNLPDLVARLERITKRFPDY